MNNVNRWMNEHKETLGRIIILAGTVIAVSMNLL